jgi:hypothetical protein
MPDPTPSPEVDDLYWEKDDVNPNHLIYDLENDKTIIPQSEDEMTITPTNNFGPQIKVRNVSDTQYRNNR